MHSPSVLGASALLATLGLVLAFSSPTPPDQPTAPVPPTTPPAADGHCVLVVEGDRNGLAITHASRKPDPWAGSPRGLTSDWQLTIRDADGRTLAAIPLDVERFATGVADVGRPATVQGCIVTDPRIAMLVNVPWFEAAAEYVFTRQDGPRAVPLGAIAAAAVRELTGGGR